MKDRQQLLNLIVGILGLVSIICGLFGIGRISALWRLIHIAAGAVMVYVELPALLGLVKKIQKKD